MKMENEAYIRGPEKNYKFSQKVRETYSFTVSIE